MCSSGHAPSFESFTSRKQFRDSLKKINIALVDDIFLRRRKDSNLRCHCWHNGFQDRPFQPLAHASIFSKIQNHLFALNLWTVAESHVVPINRDSLKPFGFSISSTGHLQNAPTPKDSNPQISQNPKPINGFEFCGP